MWERGEMKITVGDRFSVVKANTERLLKVSNYIDQEEKRYEGYRSS